ncbi:tRNA guanosine(34) transglycosylase Tgt [Spirochaeta dissipatitropha]
MITITSQDPRTNARAGILHLPHSDVETPAFMPVGTAATIKGVYPGQTEELGYRLILANTYHLLLRPGVDTVKKLGGIRQFSNWNYNILTDSGGYQVFSLSQLRKIKEEGVFFRSHIDGSKHTLTPESVVRAQADFGSDIQMALDVCTPPEISQQSAKEAMDMTSRWLKRAISEWKSIQPEYSGKLFGIVQGNFFPELRRQHAETVSEMGTPGIAVGGLSVGESFQKFDDILAHTMQFIPGDRPRYVMGIGTPDFILSAVEHGVDMFDCVLPTRIARNGTIFTQNGLVSLKRSIHRGSDEAIDIAGGTAPELQPYTRGYLHHLFNAREMLGPMIASRHNLYFMSRFMYDVRKAIKNGTYLEFKKKFLETFYPEKKSP